MANGSTISYKVRSSNAFTPKGGGNLIFTFGTECQSTNLNECAQSNLKSTDMCMLGGEYYTATYKAYPGTLNGSLVFSSTESERPIYSADYNSCSSSNGPTTAQAG
jgi:hypothetical protein